MGREKEIDELKKRVEDSEKEINRIKIDISNIVLKSQKTDSDMSILQNDVKVLKKLETDINWIKDGIDELKDEIKNKSKTALTIAISIFSPILTAIIMFLMFYWFYRPGTPLNPYPTQTPPPAKTVKLNGRISPACQKYNLPYLLDS